MEQITNLEKIKGESKMAAVTTGKIARKYMAHFLDSGSLCGGTSGYERLGKDLEEYNVELNPDTEHLKYHRRINI